MPALRRRTCELLEDTQTDDAAARSVEIGLILVILANGVAVVLESVPSIGHDYRVFFELFELVSILVFTVEYVARLWSIVELADPTYKPPLWGACATPPRPLPSSTYSRSCRSI